jgi:hypothetical protein
MYPSSSLQCHPLYNFFFRLQPKCGTRIQALDLLKQSSISPSSLLRYCYSSADMGGLECPGLHFMPFPLVSTITPSPKKVISVLTFLPVRFVGGILFIIYTKNSSEVGWIIVALILEGAGVIPLLITLVGFIRLMLVQPIHETCRTLT